MKKLLIIILLIFFLLFTVVMVSSKLFSIPHSSPVAINVENPFPVKSIDTMKYSRDLAEEKLYSRSFDSVIDAQMKLIADAGATHVAIGTPYDEKFIPILTRWVLAARKYNLSVWFRGNFSGWEEWFGYSEINRNDHKALLKKFLSSNPNLFKSGDIFSPCPECENGGPGDPRMTGDKNDYNRFLIEEYNIARNIFKSQGKDIKIYTSMNGDIARDIINEHTAKALGGTILVDHYVRTPEKFADDVVSIGKKISANIGVGEFGAPIPDLNGNMTQFEQAKYVESMFENLYVKSGGVPIINYWVLSGGSTALTSDNGSPREVYRVVKKYFNLPKVSGKIKDPLGAGIEGATIKVIGTVYSTKSQNGGNYGVYLTTKYNKISIEKEGYESEVIEFDNLINSSVNKDILLKPIKTTLWYKFKVLIQSLDGKIFTSQ